MKSRYGFTMIELMIVILVIAVLAAVAVPMMRGRLEVAKWSEAEATMSQILNDIRSYHDKWGVWPADNDFEAIGYPVAAAALTGNYFSQAAYTFDPNGGAGNSVLITASKIGPNPPSAGPDERTLTYVPGTGATTWGN